MDFSALVRLTTFYERISMKRRTLTRVIPAFAAAVALSAIAVHAIFPPLHVTVHVFNIGQGDAILIQDGYSEMLIDGGPDDTVLAKLGDAMPFFDRTIETVVLTHPHADHFIGLIGVLRRYKVKNVIFDGRVREKDPDYRRFKEAIASSGAQVTQIKVGDRITLGDRTTFTALWPPSDEAESTDIDAHDENAWSVVFRMQAEGGSAYLMGDATAEVEHRLLAAHLLSSADFLKVGHHGSRYSSSPEFLDAIHPKYAVISVGKNTYGHPSWLALQRLATRGVRVWRTDQSGDVRATFKNGTVVMRAKK